MTPDIQSILRNAQRITAEMADFDREIDRMGPEELERRERAVEDHTLGVGKVVVRQVELFQ